MTDFRVMQAKETQWKTERKGLFGAVSDNSLDRLPSSFISATPLGCRSKTAFRLTVSLA